MNTAVSLTRLTMIAATFAAAVTVHAAPRVPQAAEVVTLPMITVTGHRAPSAQLAVVTLPTITVTGKRVQDAGPMVVAHKGVAAVKTSARS
ncbi:MAG TPA: hypothetical protein VIO33_20465 [Burkholderiaceae bacterium]